MILGDVRVMHRLLQGLGFPEHFQCCGAKRNIVRWRRLCWKTDDDLLDAALNCCLKIKISFAEFQYLMGVAYRVASGSVNDRSEQRATTITRHSPWGCACALIEQHESKMGRIDYGALINICGAITKP